MIGSSILCAVLAGANDTLWVIPHTHWEGAVFYTREEYLAVGFPHIIHALQLLEQYPDYTFVLDQVAYVRPFLERYPEHVAAFHKFIAQGRLELVLGMDVMPDDNRPGGESLVRQIQYGKGYCRRELGVDVTVAWMLDTFGHQGQMPQILKLGGYQSFWFFRGVPDAAHPNEFLWEGIDGSRMPSVWLPHGYGLFWGAPNELSAFEGFAKERFSALDRGARGADRAAPSGVDVSDPEDQLPAMMKRLAESGHDLGFKLRFGVPSQFDAVVAARREQPVFKGELNPIFQGTYSSRIELKQEGREVERLLTLAEKLGAIDEWLGHSIDSATLWTAWELQLFNQTHDLASGVMTDHVYHDVVSELDHAERLGHELIDDHWERLAAAIDTRGPGVAVVVFNPLGWMRDDVAEATIGFTEPGVRSVAIVDAAGAAVPAQIVNVVRAADGGIREAHVAFLARNVPAVGYTVFHAAGSTSDDPTQLPTTIAADQAASLDNESYHVELDRATGAMTKLAVKEGGWQAICGPANVVSREDDHGDLWETYQPLDGGSRIGTLKKQTVPRPSATTRLSDEFTGEPGVVRVGPVFSEFTVSHPFDGGDFATTVRLVRGSRRIDIRTRLVNRRELVRYQVQFPTTIASGQSFHAIPFGAIDRPLDVEFPAQAWVDYGDAERGVALLNVALPGNLVADGTMLLSLLRAVTLRGYTEGGGSSDTGYELNVPRTFHYAVVPHAKSWREAGLFRDAMELEQPLVCSKVADHAGLLGSRWGLLTLSNREVVVSSVQSGRDGTLLVRVFEATGRAAPTVLLTATTRIVAASVTNLMEDPGASLAPEGMTVRFDLGPFEIKTLKLRLDPMTARR